MNKSWTSYKQVEKSHEQVDEQLMKNSWASFEQVVNKSLTSYEQVMNKSWTSFNPIQGGGQKRLRAPSSLNFDMNNHRMRL